jgi:hypothetical protein
MLVVKLDINELRWDLFIVNTSGYVCNTWMPKYFSEQRLIECNHSIYINWCPINFLLIADYFLRLLNVIPVTHKVAYEIR